MARHHGNPRPCRTLKKKRTLASVTNSDGKDSQNYSYDLAGNITAQTVAGVMTSNVYDRNRLLSSTQNGVTGAYNYDPFGRTDTVTVGGTVEQRYTYDGFDRKVSETDNAGGTGAKTTNFDYLATSDALIGEEVGGVLAKSYQYSPWGERLDQIVHNSDGTETPSYYSYDVYPSDHRRDHRPGTDRHPLGRRHGQGHLERRHPRHQHGQHMGIHF